MGIKAEMLAEKWLNEQPVEVSRFTTDALVLHHPKNLKPTELKAETERLMKEWEQRNG